MKAEEIIEYVLDHHTWCDNNYQDCRSSGECNGCKMRKRAEKALKELTK